MTEPMPKTKHQLHYYHELDEWQQDNHFIRSGYVRGTSSYKKCFQSLFYLHNETVNIYSHLLPSSLSLIAITYYINYRLEMYDNYLGIWEKLNFELFGAAVTFCMFMSSTFHCMKSHSHKVSRFGNQLDYFGIVILISCSLISVVSFALYDEPTLKVSFNILFLFFGSICAVLTLHPQFSTNVYRPLRSAMFILFGLSGALPVLVSFRKFGVDETSRRFGLFWLILEGIFYIVGAVLYALRIPERFSHIDEDQQSLLSKPLAGKYDIFGHAHQIFHVMVVIAAWCHWMALLASYHNLHKSILA